MKPIIKLNGGNPVVICNECRSIIKFAGSPDEKVWEPLFCDKHEYKSGDKVTFKGKIYDFGYIGQTYKAIIYEEGERNMQDSYAIDFEKIKRNEK